MGFLRRGFLFVVAASAMTVVYAADDVSPGITERNQHYQDGLERYFRDYLVNQYPRRAAKFWHRDYSSIAAFQASVEPNRGRYRALLAIPEVRAVGAAERTKYSKFEGVEAVWIRVPMTGGLAAEGVLAFPAGRKGKLPLVIAQHGISSFPERVFGQEDPENHYHDYGHGLLKAGYAVLAPMNLRTIESRNRIERLARLAGVSLAGLEFARMEALLNAALADSRVDAGRVGLWGISLGGMATMYWTPLEPRIRCSIVTAWFNQRRNKMVIPDPRYSCFLETNEEYAFLFGWLKEFSDADVVSLICPRPLLIQHGKKDGIAYWPQVEEEYQQAREMYRKLKIEERISIDMHEGVHEIRLESGLKFLERWLK
ncbi:MAG: hypothetical protein NTY38_01040 [Acidobacteria bacterium]|nr:hypothetical protein [Acidobacteriota bacterium]